MDYEASNARRYSRLCSSTKSWEMVETAEESRVPCARSLHAGAVWGDKFVVFGGYDGHHRVNDLHSFDFKSKTWAELSRENAPSPRDRHVATVFGDALYIFGGFDGLARVNDLHSFDLVSNVWRQVPVTSGVPPTPRHSHAAAVYHSSMFIFGGYDGSYRSDLHEFNFSNRIWSQVSCTGDIPRSRYRGTCVVCGDHMILHGGHDGNRHLSDTHVFDFITSTWSTLSTEGTIPSPRDSHVAVIHRKSMFLYGGSTGRAMSDFHELKLEFRRVWAPVAEATESMYRNNYNARSVEFVGYNNNTEYVEPITPGARFCHVGVVYEGNFYIFGGYDGVNRLNDFLRFPLETNPEDGFEPSPSTLITDLKGYVNTDLLSDVRFIVEGKIIYAHKILCLRCPYFRNLLTGEYMESRANEISIADVKHASFLQVLEYLYTDEVSITVECAMDLFEIADRFGIDRLKRLCELEMLDAITVESAAHILHTADEHNAENLRQKCMNYILVHFDEVSRTPAFEEMGRMNMDLVFEILRKR